MCVCVCVCVIEEKFISHSQKLGQPGFFSFFFFLLGKIYIICKDCENVVRSMKETYCALSV